MQRLDPAPVLLDRPHHQPAPVVQHPLLGHRFDGVDNLGPANTDWEKELTRTALAMNHNLAFSGGTGQTHYRASLNYMNEEGVALSSGLERIQGRLNATHNAFDNRLRLGLNVTTSQVNNDYLPYEVAGGFEGGVFQNVAVYNPTRPITYTDSTGVHYYEIGAGSQSSRVAQPIRQPFGPQVLPQLVKLLDST